MQQHQPSFSTGFSKMPSYMQKQQSQPIEIPPNKKEEITVNLNYIIQNKPDVKVVRDYFKEELKELANESSSSE